MTVLADRREPEKMREQCDAVGTMEWGDYRVVANSDQTRQIVVERKTATDFLQSLFSGRLNLQLEHVDILIFEKSYVPKYLLKKMKRSWEDIYNYLNGISIHTPVMTSISPVHTISILRRLEKKLEEGEYGVMRRPIMVKERGDASMRVLMGFPGLGAGKARTLLQRYGTLRDVLANIADWHNVKGFGKKVPKDVVEVLDAKW